MMRYSTLMAAAVAVVLAAPMGAQQARTSTSSPSLALESVAAQRVTAAPPNGATQATTVTAADRPGPTMASSVAGVRTQSQDAALAAPAAVDRVGRNPALMIVGGAALVVGAIIGGDAGTIVMVGGAVTGLIGLWNFLR